jgi:hypothetical protein
VGLFSKIKQGLADAASARERLASAGALGAVTIPGSATLELPAGEVCVTFEHEPTTSLTRNEPDWYYQRPEVTLTATGPAGAVELVPLRSYTGATVDTGPPQRDRGTWGTLTIPAAGSYAIVTVAQHGWYAQRNAKALLDPA